MVAGDGPKGLLLDPLEVTIRGALLPKNTISTDIDYTRSQCSHLEGILELHLKFYFKVTHIIFHIPSRFTRRSSLTLLMLINDCKGALERNE